jgi:hypothetical protein
LSKTDKAINRIIQNDFEMLLNYEMNVTELRYSKTIKKIYRAHFKPILACSVIKWGLTDRNKTKSK